MLFMATHSSTQKTSPVHDAERQAAIRQVLSNAGQNGVVMRGIYVNAPTHTMYFLFEADTADQIERVFAPIVHFGHVESVPVIDRLEL
jgi:hypothetical protein